MIDQDLKRADERDERRELIRKRERDEEQERQEAAERKKLDNLPMLDIDDKREHSGKADKIDHGGDDEKDVHFGQPKGGNDEDTNNKPSIATDVLNGSLKGSETSDLDDSRAHDDDDSPKRKDDDLNVKERIDRRLEESKIQWKVLSSTRQVLNDWSPADPDITNNGGFGKEKDNGRPVPYKLNGFPTIQRGLPWEQSQ